MDYFSYPKMAILIWAKGSANIRPRKAANYNVQAYLDDIETQSKTNLSYQLEATQVTVSKRLQDLKRVENVVKWVSHGWAYRPMKRRQNTCQILSSKQIRKTFLSGTATEDGK